MAIEKNEQCKKNVETEKKPNESRPAKSSSKGKLSLAQIKAAQQKKLEEKMKREEVKVQSKVEKVEHQSNAVVSDNKIENTSENVTEKADHKINTEAEENISSKLNNIKIDHNKTKEIKKDDPIKTKFDSNNQNEKVNPVKIKEDNLDNSNISNINSDEMPEYKSPVCCVLGHVDTGKTKLLDKLRETNVQLGEAGGITQQIGATFFPIETLRKKCGVVGCDLPGILVIDTPGHESFANLRTRGSSLCDLAILVVDIVHGLEKQTIESVRLLVKRRAPFIVALNKIDRLYDWQNGDHASVRDTLEAQPEHTQLEFRKLFQNMSNELLVEGVKTALFWENKDARRCVSVVPTSAVTGDGIADMVRLILGLSGEFMREKMRVRDEVVCTVLEVKATEGFGITVDAILSNGQLCEGDRIALCATDGVIVTVVKSLLVPAPLRELRLKSQYRRVSRVYAAAGVKVAAPGLDNAVAGSRIRVVRDDEEAVVAALDADLAAVTTASSRDGSGVVVVASTLGSMEALLSYLRDVNIPVGGVALGRLRRKDIVRAAAMSEKIHRVVLCFNTPVSRDVELLAESSGVVIFSAEIIYHLGTKYDDYVAQLSERGKKTHAGDTIFPVELRILPDCVFTSRSPLVLGVEVLRGTLKKNTPVCTFGQEVVDLGSVVSILDNKRPVEVAKRGARVAIKIEGGKGQTPRVLGRHFAVDDMIYSRVTRGSIDLLKKYFKDELAEHHLELLLFLKNKLGII